MPRPPKSKPSKSRSTPPKAAAAPRRKTASKSEKKSTDSLATLQKSVQEFCRERDWDQFHAPKNVAMALAIEAAEVMEPMRWMSEADSWHLDAKTKHAVKNEIGDVLFCLINLCQRLGVDPIEACREKLSDAAAKYPVAKSKGRANKYSDYL